MQQLKAQERYNSDLLDTLCEIRNSGTIAKYFAGMYYKAIEITNKYAAGQPDSVRNFIFGFERAFAPAFFRSYHNLVKKKPQAECWKFYYADSTRSKLQYEFIGMNAHINSDMWLALKNSYGPDTLQKYRHSLLRFQKVLNVFLDSICNVSEGYRKLEHFHNRSLGLDRLLARKMVYHWRKRQVGLALLYYQNPQRFRRKLERLQHDIHRWDNFALHYIR